MKTTIAVISALGLATFIALPCKTYAQPVSDSWTAIDEVVGPSGGPGSCPQVDWPLHLVGMSHVVIHDAVGNGIHHLIIETGVFGSATDAGGNLFVFAYENHVTEAYTVAPDRPLRVELTDHFNLEGPSGQLRQSFVVLVTTDSDGNLNVQFLPNGDISCDPI